MVQPTRKRLTLIEAFAYLPSLVRSRTQVTRCGWEGPGFCGNKKSSNDHFTPGWLLSQGYIRDEIYNCVYREYNYHLGYISCCFIIGMKYYPAV